MAEKIIKVLKYIFVIIFTAVLCFFIFKISENQELPFIKKSPELNVIIIWEKSRFKEKEILNDIPKHLKILECYEIEWNPEYEINDFVRLYNFSEKIALFKQKEQGTGKFLLLTVLDENPEYGEDKTTVGVEYVNKKMLRLKNLYRKWTGERFGIHATVKKEEVNHDLTLLLGINANDYIKKVKTQWNGEIKYLKRDLTGSNRFTSMEEFLYTINSITNYAILGKNDNTLNNYGKIDIFTDDSLNFGNVINNNKQVISNDKYAKVKIGDKEMEINILTYNKFNKECRKKLTKTLSKRKKYNKTYILNEKYLDKKCLI